MSDQDNSQEVSQSKGHGYKKDKRVKQPWTLQRCLKAARRFATEEEWRQGAPSSYKAAHSHGWVKDCFAAFRKPQEHAHEPMRKSA